MPFRADLILSLNGEFTGSIRNAAFNCSFALSCLPSREIAHAQVIPDRSKVGSLASAASNVMTADLYSPCRYCAQPKVS